jgi:ABC-type multidrug transport system fused ATPase/permease subunit
MLPDGLRMLVQTLSQILGSVILIACVQPYFLVACVFVFYLLYRAAGFYRSSARELKRIDSILRSAIYSHFGESLTGLATIRAYGKVEAFLALNYRQVDLEKCVSLFRCDCVNCR